MQSPLTFAAAIFVATAAISPVQAQPPATDAVASVAQTLADSTLAAVKVESPTERQRLLREAAKPVMDMDKMSRGVLAYAGIKVPANREAEVLDQLVGYLGDRITREIERIKPERATIGAVEVESEREALVPMALVGVKDSIDIEWHFRKQDEGWRIVDGEVSGSLLTVYFGQRLSRHARGVDQLVDYLRSQQERSQTAARY